METTLWVTSESFWVGGRSVWARQIPDPEDGIGHSLGLVADMLPEGTELGKGSVIKVTVELVQDRPASPNPYRCAECGEHIGHHVTCSKRPHTAAVPNTQPDEDDSVCVRCRDGVLSTFHTFTSTCRFVSHGVPRS